MPSSDRSVYLTFDDGPHPTITPWVLNELKKYNASATFFCIGKNVEQFPEQFQQILLEGHAIGNHTYSHLNGWQTSTTDYITNVAKASKVISSSLFRPPYGRITGRQAKMLQQAIQKENVKIIMWDVLSADFDPLINPEKCADLVLKHTEPGSIVVFHDSEKAFLNLKFALPTVLYHLKKRGFRFKKLPEQG